MWALDASSIIHAWDNYPPNQFPTLWKWLGTHISSGHILIPEVALNETKNKLPDCGSWLSGTGVNIIFTNTAILSEAAKIKSVLGISGDQYGTGVGENDLIIIASASICGFTLISNEKRQLTLPSDLRKYKIPAVCNLKNPPVPCLDFVTFLKQSGAVF